VTISGCLLLAGCVGQAGKAPRREAGEQLPKVEAVKPVRTTPADPLVLRGEYTATVEPWQRTDLCAQVRGVIKDVPPEIDIGHQIFEGKRLLEIDIPELRAELDHKTALLEQARNLRKQADEALTVAGQEVKESRAQEKKYRAEYEFRQLQFQRVTGLVQKQTVQPQLGEESRLQLASAQAALHAGQEQVLAKEAREQAARVELKVADSRIKVAEAEVARLKALVDFAEIRAPFNGVITKRWVDAGASVKDASMPLLTVMETDVVRVLIDVPERDVPYLRDGANGNPVVLQMPALAEFVPRGEFEGRVSRAAGALDPATRTMRVEIHLENKSGYLKPQMTGKAAVILDKRDNALTVPSSALARTGNRLFVKVLDHAEGTPPKGLVKRVEVQAGLDDGRRVEIRSGLTGAEWVVAKSNSAVRAGEWALGVKEREEVRKK
jgi:RND family efflux transporter MFP subunit